MNILDENGKIVNQKVMKDKSVEAKRKRWEEANKNYWADICTGELTKESLDKHTKEVGDRTGQWHNDITMLTFLSAYANKLSSHDMYMALKECKAILNEDGSLDIECPNDIIQSTISDYAEDSDRHYIAKYFGNNAWDFGLTIKGDEVYVGYDKGEGDQGVTEKVLLIKDTEGDIAKVFLDGGKFSLYLTIEAGGLYDISFSLEKVVALKKFLNDNIKD